MPCSKRSVNIKKVAESRFIPDIRRYFPPRGKRNKRAGPGGPESSQSSGYEPAFLHFANA